MTIPLKAWQIYLIAVPVVSVIVSLTGGTGDFYGDLGSIVVGVAIQGGIVLGVYYIIKLIVKKKRTKN